MVGTEVCCGCEACVSICPNKCIELYYDSLGFAYPRINSNECVNCGKCDKVCPISLVKSKEQKQPYAWGGYVKDIKLRRVSSSGGIFSALACIASLSLMPLGRNVKIRPGDCAIFRNMLQ